MGARLFCAMATLAMVVTAASVVLAQVSNAVTGTALYRERIALPPDAVFEATLEDVSKADAAAVVIGRVRVEKPGQPPFAFRIEYDPKQIDPRARYSVRARITRGETLLFTSDQSYPVITQGAGTNVSIVLRMVPKSSAPTAPAPVVAFQETVWRLTHLGTDPVEASQASGEAGLQFHAADLKVSGSTGCNRVAGTYTVTQGALTIGPLATTRMACPGLERLERRFLDALGRVARFAIEGSQLVLSDTGGTVLARFEAKR